MRFSGPAKLALAAALAVTLGAKAAWTRDAPAVDKRLFVERATALLAEAGFETEVRRYRFGRVTYGRKGGCRMMIGEFRPHGTYDEILAERARPVGPMRYVWRGELFEQAPKLLPLAEYYVQREMRRMGLRPERHPIAAVAGSSGCAVERLNWAALSTLPR